MHFLSLCFFQGHSHNLSGDTKERFFFCVRLPSGGSERHATLLFCALERRALVKQGAGEKESLGMKEYMCKLKEQLAKLLDGDKKISDFEWKDYRSNPVVIWVNRKVNKEVLACDICVLNNVNRDAFTVCFFWRDDENTEEDSYAEVASLDYWKSHANIQLGYTPVEHEHGKYRLGKRYDKTAIGYKEVAREILEMFHMLQPNHIARNGNIMEVGK